MTRGGMIGREMLRKEDPRLLTGQGRFVADLQLPHTAHLVFLRSPHAHARIARIDLSKAQQLAGVIAIFTGEDVREYTVPFLSRLPNQRIPKHHVLAVERVRYAGEPVAAVVAENAYTARDALDLIEVDYEPLPAVIDPEAALAKDSPVIYEEWNSNVAGTYSLVSGDVLQAFRGAHKVVKARVVNQRVAPLALECRAVQASYQPGEQFLTLWSTTQIPHLLRNLLSQALNFPDHRLRVIAPDVGGGFGSKVNVYREEVLACWIAMRLNQPVKWVETRRENLMSTIHGRGQIHHAELALAKDGRILGLRCRSIADIGAYLQLFTAGIPTLTAEMMPGCYKIPAISYGLTEVFTNKMATDAYRGAGRPEATYLMERMMDMAAVELGMDPAAIRLKNFVQRSEFPYTTCTDLTYDSGNYAGTLRKALRQAGYSELRAQQKQWRKHGKLLGIGLCSYVEICGTGPAKERPPGGGWESATVRVELSGKVTVLSGSSPHGQGAETSFAQIAADQLGIAPEDVAVVHGDTNAVPAGVGTFGSRTTAVGGSAVYLAARKVRDKMVHIAAHLLDAAPKNVVQREGNFYRRKLAEFRSFADVANAAYRGGELPRGMEPGLEATSYFSPPDYTYPFGAHVCVVEVDRETGEVRILRYIAVDDCGRVINPRLVEGQVHGGIAQGIAQALYEEVLYDAAGQFLNSTLVDYCIPAAAQLPRYICSRSETPAGANPLGVKGVGEAGTIGATPAVANAVVDALSHLGVRHADLPLKPQKIWDIIRVHEDRRLATPAGRTNPATREESVKSL